ncbi:hypothetical protein R4B61_06765 [Fructilactobacillus vespulae]|uniref:hypothetical protein n=1 Tax=Fructilactobacillus vespulae TaxID=1249630 RepID=UPI0039B3C4CA
MIINTLGPIATDSYQAAKQYQQKHKNIAIKLHHDFMDILVHLNLYEGELLLIPMAYQNENGKSLGDFHYQMIENMKLIDCFLTDLDPLVVLKNHSMAKFFYTHPATLKIAQCYNEDLKIKLVSSKFAAFQNYLKNGRMVITNQKNVKRLKPDEEIIKIIHSKMSWCVYQIGGN